jgi:FtsP/CotA-like multicopper oxidase with cupredoxin domain
MPVLKWRPRSMTAWTVATLVLLVVAGAGVSACARPRGATRTYYIAADEVDWDYAPADSDLTMGQPLPAAKFAMVNVPGVVARVFHKAVYREYTDSTFTTLKPRPAKWQHLGILGPVLRGAVGDTIVVVFRNNTQFPTSVHPHGVFYAKGSEGALYDDGTSGTDKADDAVPQGGTARYVWPIPERAGPGPDQPSSIMWPYHSHTHELADFQSGLVGAIIVTRRGMARPDGSPKDVDREFVTLFASFDENASNYYHENLKHFVGDTTRMGPDGPRLFGKNTAGTYHTINGYMYGNLPLASLAMHVGEHVRWYVFSGTGFDDYHSPHWHGNTVVVRNAREDVLNLGAPLVAFTADMVPDDPGTWLFHCHFGEHMEDGMSARYRVVPRDSPLVADPGRR